MATKAIAPETVNVPRHRRAISDRAILHLFIWPTLILLILWNVFPLFYSLYLSFTDFNAIANRAPNWVGFENFINHLNNEQVWSYFAKTGRYALFAVALETIIGFGLAVLVREKFKGSGIVTTLILIPMMLSAAVVGLFWSLIFNPGYGIL
jgi:multiple sugar transport system permease protein